MKPGACALLVPSSVQVLRDQGDRGPYRVDRTSKEFNVGRGEVVQFSLRRNGCPQGADLIFESHAEMLPRRSKIAGVNRRRSLALATGG